MDPASRASQHKLHPPTADRPRVGIFEAVLWTCALLIAQVLGSLLVAGLILAAFRGIPQTEAQINDAVLLLQEPPYPVVLIGCGAVIPVLIGIPAVVLRSGRHWRDRLGMTSPKCDLMLLALGATLPLTIIAASVRAVSQQIWETTRFGESTQMMSDLAPVVDQFVGGPFLLLVSVVALGPALIEEFLFRGLIGRGLIARWGIVPGIAVTTFLFAIVHLSPPYALAVVPLGLFLHFTYLVTGSLKAAIGVHFANNLFAAAAMRFGLIDGLEVGLPLVFISIGAALAIAGLLWQHRVGSTNQLAFAAPTQALAGTAVGGFTVLFIIATQ